MKKQARTRKGLTVVEMLIAVAILAIFASMAIVGTSGLFGTAEEMSVVSKAAVLGSDVMQIVTNEIRYGESFSADEKIGDESTVYHTLKFNSSSYGDNCTMYEKDGELLLTKTTISKDAAGKETSEKTDFKPIGTVAYDEVKISKLTFTLEGPTEENPDLKTAVTVTLEISGNGKTLWNYTVTIVPLYHKLTD